jgi:hypothetical protein
MLRKGHNSQSVTADAHHSKRDEPVHALVLGLAWSTVAVSQSVQRPYIRAGWTDFSLRQSDHMVLAEVVRAGWRLAAEALPQEKRGLEPRSKED